MSVWGKVSGAAAGLFVGGPIGALVGAVAGPFFLDRDSDPGVTFTIAIIALVLGYLKYRKEAAPPQAEPIPLQP